MQLINLGLVFQKQSSTNKGRQLILISMHTRRHLGRFCLTFGLIPRGAWVTKIEAPADVDTKIRHVVQAKKRTC